ncbi:MAG: response regulator [Gammaproteobacteria bacterium]|jgi:CheY-like chemotaxis protein|nr:response regulator [Xanthomonadales bacterium]
MSEIANILIVDNSKLARALTKKTVQKIKPESEIFLADNVAQAKEIITDNSIDMLITSLLLSDGDGVEICKFVRANQHYIPVLVISGDVDHRVQQRHMDADVTDYLDKSKGQSGLEFFIKGILAPEENVKGHVLYIEDSRVVAHATKKNLANHELSCDHVLSITDAIELLENKEHAITKYDVILSDYYLKDNETAQWLIEYVREILQINKIELPMVVMTGDENEKNQKKILKSGANDLVLKPVDNEILIKKVQFQIRFKQFQMNSAKS